MASSQISLQRAHAKVSWGCSFIFDATTYTFTVDSVTPESPAAYAQLRPGVSLTAVNGVATVGRSMQDIIAQCTTPELALCLSIESPPSYTPIAAAPGYTPAQGYVQQQPVPYTDEMCPDCTIS